jgi:hypothetical protein
MHNCCALLLYCSAPVFVIICRWGLDHPTQGNYQQRLAQVRLLGEAYNYMLLDSR